MSWIHNHSRQITMAGSCVAIKEKQFKCEERMEANVRKARVAQRDAGLTYIHMRGKLSYHHQSHPKPE